MVTVTSRGEIIYVPKIDEHDAELVKQGMNAITTALHSPPYELEEFTLQMRHENRPIGNLMGKTFWNWMNIDLLWVELAFQKSGIGTALIQRVEFIAREKKLTGIYLWTQSWQAEGFYKKLGYEEFTRFENFPSGHTRIGFRKYL